MTEEREALTEGAEDRVQIVSDIAAMIQRARSIPSCVYEGDWGPDEGAEP